MTNALLGMFAAAVAPVALPFAPPAAPVRYETEQSRVAGGETQRYRMVNRLDFTRLADGGWRLTLTLEDASARARVDHEALFLAGMQPMIGVPIEVRLDAAGAPRAVLNADQAWPRIVASLRKVADDLAARNGGGDSTVVKATRAYFDQFAALAGPARAERLLASVDELLPPALPLLRPGESRAWADGGRVTGLASPGTTADYRIETRTRLPDPAAPLLTSDTRLSIDRTTGLVLAGRTQRKAGDRVLAEELLRRLP